MSQLISEDVRRKEEIRLERERRERELDRERESGSLEVDAHGEKRVKMEVARGSAKVDAVVKFGYPHSTGKLALSRLFEANIDFLGAQTGSEVSTLRRLWRSTRPRLRASSPSMFSRRTTCLPKVREP